MELTPTNRIMCTVAGILGFFFCVLGSVLLGFYNAIMLRKVEKNVMLTVKSESTKAWKDPLIDIVLNVYFFNVTNSDAFIAGKEKMQVQEVGPYAFQVLYHKDAKIDEKNHQITYNWTTAYHFVPNQTTGSLQDEITLFNAPMLVGINNILKQVGQDKAKMEELLPIIENIFKDSNATVFDTRTVEQLMFVGFPSEPLKDLNSGTEQLNIIPAKINAYEFAFFQERNNTIFGPIIADSGKKGLMADFNRIKLFLNMTHYRIWKTESCNKINGTDGYLFHPGIEKEDLLHVFYPEFCRSVYFEFEKEEEIATVPCSRFALGKKVFEDPRIEKDSACFCLEDDLNACPLKGLLDLSPCLTFSGNPFLISQPHFYDGAEELLQEVDGLYPEKSKHQNYINVHQFTGFVVRLHKAFQYNIPLIPLKGLSYLEKFKKTLIPLMWFEELATLGDKERTEFKDKVLFPISMGYTALIISVCVGSVALVACVSVASYYIAKKKIRIDFMSDTDIITFH